MPISSTENLKTIFSKAKFKFKNAFSRQNSSVQTRLLMRNYNMHPQKYGSQSSCRLNMPILNIPNSILGDVIDSDVVYKCVSIISNTVANVAWFVEADPDYAGPAIPDAKIKEANAAVQSPIRFSGLTPSILKYRIARLFALTSYVPILVARERNSLFSALRLLDTQEIELLETDNGEKYYSVIEDRMADPKIYNTVEDFFSNQIEIDSYIFPIKIDSLRGYSEGGDSILYRIYPYIKILNTLKNQLYEASSASIGGKAVVGVTGFIMDKEHQRDLKESLSDRSYIKIVEGLSGSVQNIPSEFNEILKALDAEILERNIASAFGVPNALVGIGDNKSVYKDNMNDIIISFFQEVIIPRYLKPISEALTLNLLPEGMRLRFDEDTIPKLQIARAQGLANLEKVSSLTNNEKREMFGFPPLNNKGNNNEQ